jgi:hypothetical protein
MEVFLGVGCFSLLVHWRVYSCIRKEMGGFVFFFSLADTHTRTVVHKHHKTNKQTS